jgi:L-threonylcarbamoyladenylate synthase
LIAHIAGIAALEKIADLSPLSGQAKKRLALLAEKFWPGPLTLILPRLQAVPDLAVSGLATVAVRVPDHAAARKLSELSSGAVAAPSANPFGRLSPTRAEHVRDLLGEKIDLILDGGPARVGVESTVLDICGDPPRILRPGGAPKEAVEALIGPVLSAESEAAESPGAFASPGLLKSHYAPRTPLAVYSAEELSALSAEKDAAYLFFDGPSRDAALAGRAGAESPLIRTLSETGNSLEAAARLFETLHDLDRAGASLIRAQLAPERGLGAAINDRLRRAASAG